MTDDKELLNDSFSSSFSFNIGFWTVAILNLVFQLFRFSSLFFLNEFGTISIDWGTKEIELKRTRGTVVNFVRSYQKKLISK